MSSPYYFFILILGILIGLSLYFQKDVPIYLNFFPPLFLLTFIVEFIGYWTGQKNINNLPMFNFFTVFEICFFLSILRQIIGNKNVKKIILYCNLLYPLIAVANICLVSGLHAFHTVTYSLGTALIITFCLYYFYELFRAPRVGLIRQPPFWICSGLLFFYTCSLPLAITTNMLTPYTDPRYDTIFIMMHRINMGLNCLYYSTFIIAFLCRIKNL